MYDRLPQQLLICFYLRASLATEEDESPGSDWLDITLQATAQCLGRELCPPGCWVSIPTLLAYWHFFYLLNII